LVIIRVTRYSTLLRRPVHNPIFMPEASCMLAPGPGLTGLPCVIQDKAYRSGGRSINRFGLQFAVSFHNLWMEIGRAPSELQSRENLVCRLLLEKKNKK